MSVQLYRREGTSRICVAALEPPAGLRDTVPVGAQLPMTAGSGAKVLLAYADAATQQAVLPAAMFTDRALAEVRKRGWAQMPLSVSPVWPASRRRCVTAGAGDRSGVGVRADRPDGTPTRRTVGCRPFGRGRRIGPQAVTAEESYTAPVNRLSENGFADTDPDPKHTGYARAVDINRRRFLGAAALNQLKES